MNLLYVLKKELKNYFALPVVYVVLTVFLVTAGYFFYTNIVMLIMFQDTGSSIDLWQNTFDDMRFILLILLPLVSMRVFAEEKKHGTIELLFTCPLRDRDLILGKYAACLAVFCIMLACTGLYPVLYEWIHYLDAGRVLAGYTGLLLLGAMFLACGVFVSSLTESQLVAVIATEGLLLFFWFADRVAVFTGDQAFWATAAVSIRKHFFNFTRGVISTSDIVYFITICILFLFLTRLVLAWRQTDTGVRRASGAAGGIAVFACKAALCLAVLVTANYAADRWNRRYDMTPGKIYTLSPETANVLSSLQDRLKLTVFYEKGKQYLYQDFMELMRYYSRNLSYELLDIDKNRVRARAAGIDTAGAGIAEYRGRRDIMQPVSEVSLVKSVLVLTKGGSRTIRVAGAAGREDESSYSCLREDLVTAGFRLEPFVPDGRGRVPEDTAIIAVMGAAEELPVRQLQAIGRFFETGGRVLFMLGRQGAPDVGHFLKRYNIDVGDDVVIDRRHTLKDFDERTCLVRLSREHPASSKTDTPALFPLARSVQVGTSPVPGLSWTILARSGRGTWAERDVQNARGGLAQYSREEGDVYGPVSVGVVVVQKQQRRDGVEGGRMIVLGNASFADDSHINLLGNRSLCRQMVKWLSEKDDLASYRERPRAVSMPPLVSLRQQQGRVLFWSAVVFEPLVILLIGLAVFVRRHASA